MIQVSDEALVKLEELLRAEGSQDSAIRVAVMGGGSQGPGLGLIVDEPGQADRQYDVGGVPVIIDTNLIDYCRLITIDFTVGSQGKCGGASGSGFIIAPQQPLNP
jgi:Fe-S cluster assembly iron-binding protein IscA